MKELKVKVWNYKNVVLFEVLEQDESLRGKGFIFKSSNGFEINSCNEPTLADEFIYIRGAKKERDNVTTSVEFYSIEPAEEYVEKVKQAVAEYNASIKEILTDKEKEYINKVIEPFKNAINYIAKLQSQCICNQFYIRINYIDINDQYNSIDLPLFRGDSYYKSMKTEREYTLKELGLEE